VQRTRLRKGLSDRPGTRGTHGRRGHSRRRRLTRQISLMSARANTSPRVRRRVGGGVDRRRRSGSGTWLRVFPVRLLITNRLCRAPDARRSEPVARESPRACQRAANGQSTQAVGGTAPDAIDMPLPGMAGRVSTRHEFQSAVSPLPPSEPTGLESSSGKLGGQARGHSLGGKLGDTA